MPNGKRKASHYTASKRADAQPGDELVGDYSRERLIRMDVRFVERMKLAIALGLERRSHGEAPERAA